jgi:hypothetical protein
MRGRDLAMLGILLPLLFGACSVQAASGSTSGQSLIESGVNGTLAVSSDWGAGYCADVTLRNTSASAVTSWTVVVELDQSTLSQLWNGTVTQGGSQITVTPAGWNVSIAPGASASFGFCGNSTGTSYRPSLVSLAVVGGGESGKGGGDLAAGGHYQMEDLDRGVVAVKVSNGVYVGWRMQGYEYNAANPDAITYDVYRDGAKIASVADSTNHLDASGSTSSTYTVRAVVNGAAQGDSEKASTWGQNYLRIPLQIPPGGTIPGNCSNAGEAYTYSAKDASPGDVDGDGKYEIVLKWDPSNAKDNSQSGCTGDAYLDAARLHDDRRHESADLYADARPAVSDAGHLAADRVQPAAAPELPHRERHGRAAGARHSREVGSDAPPDSGSAGAISIQLKG